MKRTLLSIPTLLLLATLLWMPGPASAQPPIPCTEANQGLVYLIPTPWGDEQWLCSREHGGWILL